jgi:hypothetical protein
MVDRRIRLILRGRRSVRWYGNSEPRWKEGKNQRPCMSAEEAAVQRKRAIRLLKRHGTSRRAHRVRRRLESCQPAHRCLSGACPECQRALQRWFVLQANEMLQAENRQLRIISVVPLTCIPEGELS